MSQCYYICLTDICIFGKFHWNRLIHRREVRLGSTHRHLRWSLANSVSLLKVIILPCAKLCLLVYIALQISETLLIAE